MHVNVARGDMLKAVCARCRDGGVAATVAVAAAVVSAVSTVTVAKAVTVTAAVSKTLSPNLALIIAQHKGCLYEIRERCVLILAEH